MSMEEFEENFKEAFGRDMTPDERRWFRLASLLPSEAADEIDAHLDRDAA